ncbi:hypothetical protein ACHAWT_007904 [Skeletonema menzelii]
MPPNNRGQQKPSPSVNQRRTFRGRGGPTDGNLPPKKSPRVRVKYEHDADEDEDVQLPNNNGEDGVELDINQLSLNENDNEHLNKNIKEEEDDDDNPLQKEIHHLQKRIQNITLSIQCSPLGTSNPNTWRTNCLYPVKNVVKEWRSILSFHDQEIRGGEREREQQLQQLLHETATKVFIMVQMVMQSGPLVGSNAGYFKRCGGEVASIALEFLTHVIDLSGITITTAAEEEEEDDDDDVEDQSEEDVDGSGVNADAEINYLPDSGADSNDDESSSSSAGEEDREGENDGTAILASETSQSLSSTKTNEVQVVQTLQNSFLFTEKQSQRIHQWHRNAQKAADTNKLPSKSASKLQSQKSKKQRQKDLKMERKLKKKSKGQGRK